MPVSEQIKQAFTSGATILTSTARAARWLRREYALEQRAVGRRAWPTPPIEDWDTWLRQLWLDAALNQGDAPLLLTSLQERSIWTRMLKAERELVVSSAGMVALAESAYALLSSYGAHGERKRVWGRPDADSFRRWAANFDAECERRDWLPDAGIEGRVVELLTETKLPTDIVLVGFERMKPAQKSLLLAFGRAGAKIVFAAPEPPGTAEYVRATGQRQEIEACARWVRERISENPEARIGILASDPGAVRNEIERTFRRILAPKADNVFSSAPMPFEFSLGTPLADLPVIRAALLLLRWLHEPLAEEEVTWLLLSGLLLQSEADYLTMAKLDAERRDSGALSLEISLHNFLESVGAQYRSCCEGLARVLHFAKANQFENEERLPRRWTDLIQMLLEEAGWPGAGQRDTIHFQALRRWERALDEVALLDFDGHRTTYGEFVTTLTSHAQEVIFAAESEGAPVQIMGVLEASGQQFDALWFLSVDDQSWPPRSRLHPLLPSDVQRRYGMPYADPAADLELAKVVTDRIAASASRVVFSYAERNKDGELRPSALLLRDAVWRAAESWQPGQDKPELEVQEEDAEVAEWPREEIAGGSEVLKKQAACPFQAFANKRLLAEPLNRNEWGLSAAERGQLLHDVLCRIWHPETGALHTLDDLKAAKRDGRLDEVLRRAIAESFARHDRAEGWEHAYIESEKRRLLKRLWDWFMKEDERAAFTVKATEERLDHVHIEDLKLRLRVDRVDELADGSLILIDYKSGDVSEKDWEPPRPKEPQLPLYAIFGGVEGVCGVLFAKIRAGEGKPVKGCIASADVKVMEEDSKNKELAKRPYSAELRDEWEQELRRLAGDFLRGDATVDPKNGKDTCKYCGLQGLCRVTESHGWLDDQESENEGDDA